jgi:spore maturation protein CgeB
MKIVLFYHSLLSDWNHGNAHFLRGVARALGHRGHEVLVYEALDNWSLRNLVEQHGLAPLRRFHDLYPDLLSRAYDPANLDLDVALGDADLVLVHEWNPPELVRRVGEARRRHGFTLFFHDTHHRLVTRPEMMRAYDLSNYDGVLAFGRVLRDLYLRERLALRAFVWHEAADTSVFYPREATVEPRDLVWIGNWGDEERSAEIHEFLLDPVRQLFLSATVHGVRYPPAAVDALAEAGIDHRGWLPNFDAPEVFARHRVTVHVPRRPYVRVLPGIPTIRPFEAMACGIPLVSAPWEDAEGLFTPGEDYLVARDGPEMCEQLSRLLSDSDLRREIAGRALSTVRARHTCSHRVDELLGFHWQVVAAAGAAPARLASAS